MKPRRQRAFTLLEVMIVVGMAALVMAISIPFVQRAIRHDDIYQAVKVVEDACLNARATAIFNNRLAELVIRPQDKAFSVRASGTAPRPRSPDTAEGPGDPEAPTPGPAYARHAPKPFSGQLGDDVSIELLGVNFTEYQDEEETRVRFHPNGTSDEFTVLMRIGPAAWRKITLDIVTGLPTLEVIR